MTILPTASPTAPDSTKQSVTAQSVWNQPRTTPDGDIMPGEEPSAGATEMSFGDFLDVINPLQHLPVVGTIYRALTGDTMSDAARMAGGALYGGPFGVVGALANVIVERDAGQDIGGSAMAWLTGGPDADAETALADAGRAQTQSTPINAAPVTIAAANASPQALAARAAAAAEPQITSPLAAQSRVAHSTTEFQGRSADRLDAFIRQANAVRRGNPMASVHRAEAPAARPSLPRSIDATRVQTAALKPPGIGDHAAASNPAAATSGTANRGTANRGTAQDGAELALAGGDAGSVNQWMLRALDKYEHMRKQEAS